MTENLELAVLSDAVSRLESAGFDYMLTGSVAMNYYAEPRMTRDIDIGVALAGTESQLEMQLNDVRNLLATKPDLDYLRDWSSKLGLELRTRLFVNLPALINFNKWLLPNGHELFGTRRVNRDGIVVDSSLIDHQSIEKRGCEKTPED